MKMFLFDVDIWAMSMSPEILHDPYKTNQKTYNYNFYFISGYFAAVLFWQLCRSWYVTLEETYH